MSTDDASDSADLTIEVNGTIYRRELFQEKARVEAERHQRQDRLYALVAELPEVTTLVTAVINDTVTRTTEDMDDAVRKIGWLMVANDQRDLWRVAFLHVFEGDAYVLGDEGRFLLGRPTGGVSGIPDPDQAKA